MPGSLVNRTSYGFAKFACSAGLVLLAALASPGEPKYSGKTFEQWVEALEDLNPAYRAEGLEALGHFGKRAVPHLQKTLEGPDPEAAALAGTVLLGMGDVGRAALTIALTDKPLAARIAAIQALERSREDIRWALPILQTIATDPKTTMLAQRVLARLAADSQGLAVDTLGIRGPEMLWQGSGVAVRWLPPDCFVTDQFPLLRLGVSTTPPAAVKTARLYFRAALGVEITKSGDVKQDWYYVVMDAAGEPDPEGYRPYHAKLPQPLQGAAAIVYYGEIVTTDGKVLRSDEFSGSIMMTAEDCRSIGRRAAEFGPRSPVTVWSAGSR